MSEARLLHHRYLGTEHLLLALASDEGLAGSMLEHLGISPEGVMGKPRRSRPSCAGSFGPVAGRGRQAYDPARARLTLERRHPAHQASAQSLARDGFTRAAHADLPRRRRASAPFPDHYNSTRLISQTTFDSRIGATTATIVIALLPMYSPKTMWRALTPSLIVAVLVMGGAGLVYGLPAWIVHSAIVPAVLSVLPAEERWERHQHPRLPGP